MASLHVIFYFLESYILCAHSSSTTLGPLHTFSDNFILVDQSSDYNAAKAYCLSEFNSTLASIHNADESLEAGQLCGSLLCYVGLNDLDNERYSNQSGWVWQDASIFDYQDWAANEPNNYGAGEHCVNIYSGQWFDIPCGLQRAFLCNTNPRIYPTASPSNQPSIHPTSNPTNVPTIAPSKSPTFHPSIAPSESPTLIPTYYPTKDPTIDPTMDPTSNPSANPTSGPTKYPSTNPSSEPTQVPTIFPTMDPTKDPTSEPTTDPSLEPTQYPSMDPTVEPTMYPTEFPSSEPTLYPTTNPSSEPTRDPTVQPTADPTIDPTSDPTDDPTIYPTSNPSQDPTTEPTINPTTEPTIEPTMEPTLEPTKQPTQPTVDPVLDPTIEPTLDPTGDPSVNPTYNPSSLPTTQPTTMPIDGRTAMPTIYPTLFPTAPTPAPTAACVIAPYISVDTSSLTHWLQKADGKTAKSSTFTILNDANNCQGHDPCIRLLGISGSASKIYLEQTFNSSMWSQVNIQIEARTNSFDNSAEKGFIETVCNGIAEQNEFNVGMGSITNYDACLTRDVLNCDSFILRIGGYLSGTGDYVYLSQLLMDGLDATLNPSAIPTIQPTIVPTDDPTSMPTTYPSSVPTVYPTKQPSINPSAFPSSIPSSAPSSVSPTQIPTTFPTNNPIVATMDPSKAPSMSTTISFVSPLPSPTTKVTQSPTRSPFEGTTTNATLKRANFTGQCDFKCSQCLDAIDILQYGNSYDFAFSSAANESNCSCPEKEAKPLSDDEDSIGIGESDQQDYYLEITKTDDQNLRVSVVYWDSVETDCNASYSVNVNEFLGIKAENVLIVTFTICDLPESAFSEDVIEEKTQNYTAQFAQIFNVSEDAITVEFTRGSFCTDTSRRRLLQGPPSGGSGNDQESTITIVFADAEDAKAAESFACTEVTAEYKTDDCGVVVTSPPDDLEVVEEEPEPALILGMKRADFALMFSFIVVGILIVAAVGLYIFSAKKKEWKKRIKLREGNEKSTLTTSGKTKGDSRSGHHDAIQISQSMRLTNENVQLNKSTVNLPTSGSIAHLRLSNDSEQASSGPADDNDEYDEAPMNCNLQRTESGNENYVKKSSPTVHEDAYKYGVMAPGINADYEECSMSTSTNLNDEGADNKKKYKTQKEMIDHVIKDKKANKIENDDLTILKQIGKGQFGSVHKAMWEGNVVVVKYLAEVSEVEDNEKIKAQKAARLKEMEAEIVLAASLPTHSNLVTIFGYCQSPFGVVMSYLAGDSVQKYVYRKNKKNDWKVPKFSEIMIILRKAAAGLSHLHSHGLIHRDIACRNILLGQIMNGKGVVAGTEVKISDFGLTRKMADIDSSQKTVSNFGPLKWMSPESIRSKIYSTKSDVYMFAITMHEIFYGEEPYPGMRAYNIATDVVTKQIRPTIKTKSEDSLRGIMPDAYEELMKKCWHVNSKKRPNFNVIIKQLALVESNLFNRVP